MNFLLAFGRKKSRSSQTGLQRYYLFFILQIFSKKFFKNF